MNKEGSNKNLRGGKSKRGIGGPSEGNGATKRLLRGGVRARAEAAAAGDNRVKCESRNWTGGGSFYPSRKVFEKEKASLQTESNSPINETARKGECHGHNGSQQGEAKLVTQDSPLIGGGNQKLGCEAKKTGKNLRGMHQELEDAP